MTDWGNFYFLIPGVAGALGVSFLTFWASRKTSQNICRLGWPVRCIYLAGILFALFGIYAVIISNPSDDNLNDEWWLPYAMILMLVVFLLATFDGFIRRVRWNQHAALFSKLGVSTKTVPWEDISSVEYKAWFQYWRVGFKDGSGFAIFEIMNGVSELLEELKRRGLLDK